MGELGLLVPAHWGIPTNTPGGPGLGGGSASRSTVTPSGA